MATSKEEIQKWLQIGVSLGATHMIVAVDTWDYSDYPVYVSHNGPDVHSLVNHYNGAPMSRVMEVYSYALPLEDQLMEPRAFNL